ncbi:MAG TPA: hypothetical protein VMS65_05520 [Polyangiaceae bacterium]|nr:hypothetical protein [Polyangiaceae bacterium]
MSWLDPDGTHGKRRRLAILVLAIGAAAVVVTVSKDYPHEQPVVFRLPDTKRATLVASFTRVGETEASTGFTLELGDRAFRDVNHTIRLPNGDYIVTVEVRRERSSGHRDGGESQNQSPKETSVSERVTLSGSEVVVPVPARASE